MQQVIQGKYDLWHKRGHEFRNEKLKLNLKDLQKEFKKRMNNPYSYQIESPKSNWSHEYEYKEN
ncbi:MAG: GH-E family nuclease [Candidatus Freyarchaeum deiterrae]